MSRPYPSQPLTLLYPDQNPAGTLPTLKGADGKLYTSSTDVTKHLVQIANKKVAAGHSDLIAKIHEDKYDPNFILLTTVRANNPALACAITDSIYSVTKRSWQRRTARMASRSSLSLTVSITPSDDTTGT